MFVLSFVLHLTSYSSSEAIKSESRLFPAWQSKTDSIILSEGGFAADRLSGYIVRVHLNLKRECRRRNVQSEAEAEAEAASFAREIEEEKNCAHYANRKGVV